MVHLRAAETHAAVAMVARARQLLLLIIIPRQLRRRADQQADQNADGQQQQPDHALAVRAAALTR